MCKCDCHNTTRPHIGCLECKNYPASCLLESNVIQGSVEDMMAGIKLAVDLIRPTYGSHGTNVIVESNLKPLHGIFNDAWSIVKDIKIFNNPAAKVGLDFVKELCERADKLSGDSRKTTIILLEEILKAGHEAKVNKLQLKRELDALIPLIEAEIDGQTKQITIDEVESVATTASENVDTGKLLKEIYQQIGKNGIIHCEGSGTFENSVRIVDGIRFDMTGSISASFLDEKTKQVFYENPLILVTKKKITTDDDINPVLSELEAMEEKPPLIIFTNDMDSGVGNMLVNLHKSGRFKICIIKAPTLWQDFVFEDFAKCTGSTIIEDATGLTLKKIPLSALGTCGKITVDAEETVINGYKDISAHIEYLKSKGDEDSQRRLSWLTKTAILRLGSNSETDLSYRRLKTHDAIRSSQLALKYGVVPGGGLCLYQVSEKMPDTVAGKIMRNALFAPFTQIKRNGCDTIAENIVDSSMVIKMAARNALGIASTILTAPSLIYIPKPTELDVRLLELTRQSNVF